MESHTELWRGRRVLVTGCTGFLGSAVTRELLAHGAIVAGLVRERCRAAEYSREISESQFHIVHSRVEDSVRLHTAMALHEVSAVFHLASADSLGNDRGSLAVTRAVSLYHPKVPVIVSRPMLGLRLAGREVESPVLMGITRFGEIFGPGDRKETHVVPRTVAALIRGEHPRVEDGSARDFLFVDDAARACLAVAEAVGIEQSSHDATFRSGWQHTDREMIDLVRAAFAGEQLADREPEPPANPLDWLPSATLGESLHETIAALHARPQAAGIHWHAQRRAA